MPLEHDPIDRRTLIKGGLAFVGASAAIPPAYLRAAFDENSSPIASAADLAAKAKRKEKPVEPPAEPYHILAQQLMALVLQERGIGRHTWFEWVASVPYAAAYPYALLLAPRAHVGSLADLDERTQTVRIVEEAADTRRPRASRSPPPGRHA